MRLVVFSDIHIDARTAGVERLPEFLEFVDAVARDAEADRPDWVVCLGDCFDPGRDDLRYAAVLIEVALRLHAAARRGSVWLAGNHDVVHRSDVVTTLSPLRAVAGSGVLPGTLHVLERPALVELGPGHGFLGLPYPSAAARQAYRADLDQAIGIATRAVETGTELVVGAHLSVTGAALGSESYEMARGGDVALPADRLAALRPVLVVNGHYHLPQVVSVGGLEVVVPGSPLRLHFPERESRGNGYLAVEL